MTGVYSSAISSISLKHHGGSDRASDLNVHHPIVIPSGVIKRGVLETPQTEGRLVANRTSPNFYGPFSIIFQHGMFDYRRVTMVYR